MTFRSDKKQSKEVFLYEPIGGDDGEGNSLSFLDVLESLDAVSYTHLTLPTILLV